VVFCSSLKSGIQVSIYKLELGVRWFYDLPTDILFAHKHIPQPNLLLGQSGKIRSRLHTGPRIRRPTRMSSQSFLIGCKTKLRDLITKISSSKRLTNLPLRRGSAIGKRWSSPAKLRSYPLKHCRLAGGVEGSRWHWSGNYIFIHNFSTSYSTF
jgi:hypothetical protein